MTAIIENPAETAVAALQSDRDFLLRQQHILLENISWNSYELLLNEAGDHVRLTFHNGSLEITRHFPFTK